MPKGSDLLVAALEREGVDRIFGVPGEENLDVVESPAHLLDRARPHPPRASRRLHGRHPRPPHRQTRRVHLNARSRRAQLLHRRRLRPSRRHADDHDHRPEGDHDRPPGPLPDRRRDRLDEAAHQDDAPDRQRGLDPGHRARGVPRRHGGAARPGASRAAGGRGGRGGRARAADPAAPGRHPGRPPGGARPGGRDDPRPPRTRSSCSAPPQAARACTDELSALRATARASRSSPPRWARARSRAGPTSTWAPPPSPSATTCIERSTGPT